MQLKLLLETSRKNKSLSKIVDVEFTSLNKNSRGIKPLLLWLVLVIVGATPTLT